jgi:hypothetical protein
MTIAGTMASSAMSAGTHIRQSGATIATDGFNRLTAPVAAGAVGTMTGRLSFRPSASPATAVAAADSRARRRSPRTRGSAGAARVRALRGGSDTSTIPYVRRSRGRTPARRWRTRSSRSSSFQSH